VRTRCSKTTVNILSYCSIYFILFYLCADGITHQQANFLSHCNMVKITFVRFARDHKHNKYSFLAARRCSSAVLTTSLCLSVCLSVRLSVTNRCSIQTAEQIDLNFVTEATFHLSCIMLHGNSGIFKNKGISLRNFSQTLDFEKFRNCTSTVASAVNLVRPTTVTSSSH